MEKYIINEEKYNKVNKILEEKNVNLFNILFLFLIYVVNYGIYYAIWGKFIKLNYTLPKMIIGLIVFMPYTHCKKAISIKGYKLGVLLPTIILGFMPTILGVVLQNSTMAGIGTLMIALGSGDIMVFWVIRNSPDNSLVSDHPVKPGCVVYMEK